MVWSMSRQPWRWTSFWLWVGVRRPMSASERIGLELSPALGRLPVKRVQRGRRSEGEERVVPRAHDRRDPVAEPIALRVVDDTDGAVPASAGEPGRVSAIREHEQGWLADRIVEEGF